MKKVASFGPAVSFWFWWIDKHWGGRASQVIDSRRRNQASTKVRKEVGVKSVGSFGCGTKVFVDRRTLGRASIPED